MRAILGRAHTQVNAHIVYPAAGGAVPNQQINSIIQLILREVQACLPQAGGGESEANCLLEAEAFPRLANSTSP